MPITTRTLVLVGLIGVFSAPEARPQEFQWPEEPKNLQVLPDGVKGRELGAVMRSFATGLGVGSWPSQAADAGRRLAEVVEKDGVSGAKKTYRELRAEYCGGFSYDFSAGRSL